MVVEGVDWARACLYLAIILSRAKVAELGLEKDWEKSLLLQPSRAPTAEEKKLIFSQERVRRAIQNQEGLQVSS